MILKTTTYYEQSFVIHTTLILNYYLNYRAANHNNLQ